MRFSTDILEEFESLTGKNIKKLFQDSLNFFSYDYQIIVDYYSGRSSKIDSQPFTNLEQLQLQKSNIFEAYHSHSRMMKDSRWWDLLEFVEEIDNRLETLKNINRWSRSSITSTGYSPNIQIEHTLTQNETLENVAKNILGLSNPQDSWVDIALSNNLEEEDYDTQGGNDLLLETNRTVNLGIQVNSVVDYISGKSIYGKDIYRKIQFVSDDDGNDDLQVLGYDETVVQSVDILANLKKNDNPDFPTLGLQSSVTIGGNRAMLNFPVIVRQLTETFSSDDTLKDFQVDLLSLEQDNLSIDYQVKTRLNELQPGNILL